MILSTPFLEKKDEKKLNSRDFSMPVLNLLHDKITDPMTKMTGPMTKSEPSMTKSMLRSEGKVL